MESIPTMYLAVARDTTWDPKRTYDAPAGFHHATLEEVTPLCKGSNIMLGCYYNDKAGWAGYTFNEKSRYVFRIRGPGGPSLYAGAWVGCEPSNSFDTRGFGGIVCIRDA